MSSPSDRPSTGSVRGCPLLAPVVVNMTTGRPLTRLVNVARRRTRRKTSRSTWCRPRADTRLATAVAASRRAHQWNRFVS